MLPPQGHGLLRRCHRMGRSVTDGATEAERRPYVLRQPSVVASTSEEVPLMKNVLLGALALAALPIGAANAQSMFSPGPAYPGFYVGAEGGLNWLLDNNSYSMNTGWAAGGKVGYDFVGPRIELEGIYRQNNGTGVVGYPNGGFAFQSGKINQVSAMANVLYDFAPGATITPYVGAGAGIAFVDPTINGCSLCSTQFAYQAILGLGWNVDRSFRVNLDGRYYGTTSPGAYQNNNISMMLGLTY